MKYQIKFLLILLTLLTINTSAQIINSVRPVIIVETKGATSPSVNRRRGLEMLDQIKDILKDRYYDSNYRGI
ncbi:MAG TPA: hypothetical protein VEQ34_12380, partial [Pyrinomonadaceae bacterium]|nr:hypothetical protein [Pyrinomonadaceae bacterium]